MGSSPPKYRLLRLPCLYLRRSPPKTLELPSLAKKLLNLLRERQLPGRNPTSRRRQFFPPICLAPSRKLILLSQKASNLFPKRAPSLPQGVENRSRKYPQIYLTLPHSWGLCC